LFSALHFAGSRLASLEEITITPMGHGVEGLYLFRASFGALYQSGIPRSDISPASSAFRLTANIKVYKILGITLYRKSVARWVRNFTVLGIGCLIQSQNHRMAEAGRALWIHQAQPPLHQGPQSRGPGPRPGSCWMSLRSRSHTQPLGSLCQCSITYTAQKCSWHSEGASRVSVCA